MGKRVFLGHSETGVNTVIQILSAVGDDACGGRRDGQLLDQFVQARDVDAFAELVRRHGPMVLGVCRRVLGNAADADDAFQATFLVLARKAVSIAGRDRLAAWLHGVAFNAARKLRRANARRANHERACGTVPELAAEAPEPRFDLLAILDEELGRLPDRYRAVLVLCDLEGRTRTEAARALGCPEGTVGGRLARARGLLAVRLSARGVSSVACVLAVALADGAVVAVPPGAVAALVRAVGVDGLAHAAARGFVSRRVVDTTEGVVRSMFATKLQKVVGAVLCCGLALACGVGAIHLANAQPGPAPMSEPERPVLLGLKEPPKAETGPQKGATVVPLRKLDATETARVLNELFGPKFALVTPLPDDKALLVYADPKVTKDIEAALLKMGETAPKKATVFKLDKKVDPAETAKTLAEVFGKDRATFIAVPNDGVLLAYASEPDTQSVQKLLAKLLIAAEHAKGDGLVRKTLVVEHRPVREVTEVLQKLFGDRLHSLGWEEPNKLLVVGTADAVATAVKLVEAQDRPLVPTAPRLDAPPKKFTLKFENVTWTELLDWYAKESGLALVSTAKPTGRVTVAAGNRQFTLAEVTDLINEALMQQKFILVRRKTTFFLHPADEKLDPGVARQVELKDLKACGRTEIVEVLLPISAVAAPRLEDKNELRKLLTPFGDFVLARDRFVLVRDTAGNVARIAQVIADSEIICSAGNTGPPIRLGGELSPGDPRLGRAEIDPLQKLMADAEKNRVPDTGIDPHMVLPEAKPVTFKFKDAPWPEVFEAYEKVTGLKGAIKSKPTGTFTFTPSPTPRQYTLAEFTDIVNDALLTEKHLLVRNLNTFVVISAGEKVDAASVPRVAPGDLGQRGRTELVQVVFAVAPVAAGELIADVKKLLGPFGSVTVLRSADALLVQDVAENVIKVYKALGTATEQKPRK